MDLPPPCETDSPPELDFAAFSESVQTVRKLLPQIYCDAELTEMLSLFESAIKSVAHVTAATMMVMQACPEEVAGMSEGLGIPIQEFQNMMHASSFLPRP